MNMDYPVPSLKHNVFLVGEMMLIDSVAIFVDK